MPAPIHFTVTVERIERHSPDVATFHLAWTGRRPRFLPGQFVHVALDCYDPSSHWPESRAFSIASASGDPQGMRLTVGRQGRFTSRVLDEVEPGRRLWCKGPYGEFEVRAGNPDEALVMIAGGTGITPFCAFMEDALLRPTGSYAAATLYYGARTPNILVYRNLASRWEQSVPGARVVLFAEEGADVTDIAGVLSGRLDIDRIVAEQSGAGPCRYFVSGPKIMIQGFVERLIGTHAVPADLVVIDAWG